MTRITNPENITDNTVSEKCCQYRQQFTFVVYKNNEVWYNRIRCSLTLPDNVYQIKESGYWTQELNLDIYYSSPFIGIFIQLLVSLKFCSSKLLISFNIWDGHPSIILLVAPIRWSNLKIVIIRYKLSHEQGIRIDDKYINNFATNLVSAVFHSRVIRRSVSPRFIELCME